MGTSNYQDGLHRDPSAHIALDPQRMPDSPRDMALAPAMRARAAAAYEAALLPQLLSGLRSREREDGS